MKTFTIVLFLLVCLCPSKLNSQITWEEINVPHSSEIKLIEIGPDNTIYILVDAPWLSGVSDSLLRSVDDGKNWEQLFVTEKLICNDIYLTNNNAIYLAAGEFWGGGLSGVFFCKDGSNWEYSYIEDFACDHIIKVLLDNDGELLAINEFGNLFQYNADEKEWKSILNETNLEFEVNDLISNDLNEYVASTTSGVYTSSDKGETWHNKNSNIECEVNCARYNQYGKLYIGTKNEGIYLFNDTSKEWEALGLTGENIQVILPRNEINVIASTEENGVFYTNNKGQNWVSCSIGLDALTIKAMAVAPTGHIYVSTGKKVFKSVESFDGIYQAPNSTVILNLKDKHNHLYPNYPNPFSGLTTISFSLDKEQEVCLSVYNNQGKLVDIVLQAYEPAGTHQVIWQAGNNPPGIYYYRLETAKGTVVSKPMLLVNN